MSISRQYLNLDELKYPYAILHSVRNLLVPYGLKMFHVVWFFKCFHGNTSNIFNLKRKQTTLKSNTSWKMALSFALNTDVNTANGERERGPSVLRMQKCIYPQRGVEEVQERLVSLRCTGRERFLVFPAFCHHRSLSGALGITYNPHPREPQHFSMICKPNCWRKQG